jgi:hypothetical protein
MLKKYPKVMANPLTYYLFYKNKCRLWKFMSENQEVFVGSTEQGLAKVNKCSYIHFYCNKPKTNIFEKKTVI